MNTFLGHEVFDHPAFTGGDTEQRHAVMDRLTQGRYEVERENPYERYFGVELGHLLRGKDVLDLGCFVGGAGVAWAERYAPRQLVGMDVRQVYLQAARRFALKKRRTALYATGLGEHLPFGDNSFDAIITFDVFEHVRNLSQVMSECRRVLRSSGALLVVFPSYLQPIEHHLSMVTGMPFLHWFFEPQTLMEAYNQVIRERGPAADWYRRSHEELEPWERLNTINGTSYRAFRSLVNEQGWGVVLDRHLPLFSVGSMAKRHKWLAYVSRAVSPLAKLPVCEEVLAHRIVFILRKRSGIPRDPDAAPEDA